MQEEHLLIIDVQKGFINDWTRHIPALVQALQRDFRRVTATRFINPPGSLHRQLIGFEKFGPESTDIELAFEPTPGTQVIDKNTYSCLVGDFGREMKSSTPRRLHLCGIATDNCVLKTAVDLFEAGIEPIVHAGVCASHGGKACHEAGLMLLGRMIGSNQIVRD